MVRDLVTYGLAIVVAPVAAAASAAGMRASSRRVLATAGLAVLLAFAMVSLLDYSLTFMLIAPGSPGRFHAKGEVSKEEVARAAEPWLLGRHVMACVLGLVGGSILGVWRALPRASPARSLRGSPSSRMPTLGEQAPACPKADDSC